MYIYVKVVSVERWFGGITKRLSWESSDNKTAMASGKSTDIPYIYTRRTINQY